MSRDRRNREFDDDSRDARRVAKHSQKKKKRHDTFDHKIKDVIASGNFEEIDEMMEDEKKHRR